MPKEMEILDLAEYPRHELVGYFTRLFKLADKNNDGLLDPAEIEKLLQLTNFALSKDATARVVAMADTNKDGKIDLNEFLPMAIETLTKGVTLPEPA